MLFVSSRFYCIKWCPGTESNRRHEDFQYWFHGFCLILKSSYHIVILIFCRRSGCYCILAVSAFLCNFPSTFTQELHRDFTRHAAYCGRSAEYRSRSKSSPPVFVTLVQFRFVYSHADEALRVLSTRSLGCGRVKAVSV